MMDIEEADPLEGSSYDLGVTVKAEVKQEDEDENFSAIRRTRRVSGRQVHLLWEFLNKNRDVAIAHNRSLEAKEYAQKKWKDIAEILNSQDDGPRKDWKSWCKYWVDYKAKLKIKLAAVRASMARNVCGPTTEKPLTKLEEKFLEILGHDFGQGPASMQLEPNFVHSLWVERCQDAPPSGVTITLEQEDSASESSFKNESSIRKRSVESAEETEPRNHQNPSQDDTQAPPASSPSVSPPHSPRGGSPSPWVRKRRRQKLSQEDARRSLVESSKMRAEAAVRTSEAMEQMALNIAELQNTAKEIVRALIELAQCIQSNQEPIELNSTDAMLDPRTSRMICLHCLQDFEPTLLLDHMVSAHNYRRVILKCHTCMSTFQERRLLSIHRQTCRPEANSRKRKTFSQILREVETKYFLDDQDLLEPVSCPICLLELPKYCVKEHLLNEHRKADVIVTCGKCNRNFKSKLTLREHVKLVHEAVEDSVECQLCGQKFRSLKYLANHKRNVHPSGNKIHKCSICGKEFKSHLCLHQHTKYVHPPESASVVCPHCPHKVFKSKMNLAQHLKVSHGWKKQ